MAALTAHGAAPIAAPQIVEGVSVTGEAIRRVTPEHAEFVIEVTTGAATAAQALRDNQTKVTQIGQALQPLGVHAGDVNAISQNIVNVYAPVVPALPAFGIAAVLPGGGPPDIQFATWHARSLVRIAVRDAARAGEVLDAATRAGAGTAGAFQFRASDDASARRSTLEAAGKDARQKAEALAAAAGKKLGEPVSISEELVASNGTYTALRSAMPFAFGAGMPQATGELEYYARVSASFRLQ
jgi:hypothetical protein